MVTCKKCGKEMQPARLWNGITAPILKGYFGCACAPGRERFAYVTKIKRIIAKHRDVVV